MKKNKKQAFCKAFDYALTFALVTLFVCSFFKILING